MSLNVALDFIVPRTRYIAGEGLLALLFGVAQVGPLRLVMM